MDYGRYVNPLPHGKHRTPERDAYQRRQCELEESFKRDLFAELDIASHPKREVLYEIAWSLGHAYGYAEVFSIASQLEPLLR